MKEYPKSRLNDLIPFPEGKPIDKGVEDMDELNEYGKYKTIGGFGAPAKATTLMYQFGFNKDLIDFIVDDNPLKQNTFTPGLHIPVYSSMAIKQNTPDYILILAWNFAESIIKNHSYFTNQNGRFIIPLPQIIII